MKNISFIESFAAKISGNETVNAIESYETGTTDIWNRKFQRIVDFADVKTEHEY